MYALDPILFKDDSNNYNIHMKLIPPIEFDQQNYNYYLKLLSCSFSLVDPNLFEGVNDTVIAKLYNSLTSSYRTIGFVFDEGLYDLNNLVSIFNNLFLKAGSEDHYAQLTFNEYTSKLSLRIYPDVLTADGFDSIIFSLNAKQAFLQNTILGFTQWNGLNTNLTMDSSNSVITALRVPIIQSYNNLILKTNLIKPASYITDPNNPGNSIRTNALLSFSSSIKPNQLSMHYSFTDLLYPISQSRVNEISFSLTGENNEVLKVSAGKQTDFSIQAVILVARKI